MKILNQASEAHAASTSPNSPTTPSSLWGYKVLLLIATAVWGLGTVVIKSTVNEIPASWIVGIRFAVAGVLLGVVALRQIKSTLADKGHWVAGAVLGVFVYLSYETNSTGLAFTTASNSAFLTTLYVVIVPFLGWAFNKKPPTKYNVVAALVCIAGVGCIAYAGSSGFSLNFGDIITLLSTVFLSFHILFTAKFAPGKNMITLTVVQFLVAGLLGLITGAFTDPFPPMESVSTSAWLSLAYLAVFASCIALLLQNLAVARVPAAQASLFLSFESVFGVLFSVMLLGEILTPSLLIGFVLIFASLVISEYLPTRAKRTIDVPSDSESELDLDAIHTL